MSAFTFLHRWRPGQHVHDTSDPRHVGQVVYTSSNTVRVLWANGWRTDYVYPHITLEKST